MGNVVTSLTQNYSISGDIARVFLSKTNGIIGTVTIEIKPLDGVVAVDPISLTWSEAMEVLQLLEAARIAMLED